MSQSYRRSTRSTEVKTRLECRDILRGTGYYIRLAGSREVYTLWKDTKCVAVLSNAYPGHSQDTVRKRVKCRTGFTEVQEVPIPLPI